MIELVTVIVILGVLSVFVSPRGFIGQDVQNRGFHDETLSYLRYAQKTAVAQRRSVCIVFTLDSVALSIATSADNSRCGRALPGPAGGKGSAVLVARQGTVFVNTPVDFTFNALGQPVGAENKAMATQTWQVVRVARSIVVESDTGYVHD